MSLIVTACAPPGCSAWEIPPHFLFLTPVFGFLAPESPLHALWSGFNARSARTFPPGIQLFGRFMLLHCTPIDDGWRQRESFNAVKDRCE
jgi:hypothetical protein